MDQAEWGEYRFDNVNLFKLLKVQNKLSKSDLDINGKIPVYSSESTNNGIIGYTKIQPEFIVNAENPIYLVFGDHTRSFNIATENFCVADNVKVLSLNGDISIKSLLYIISSWKKNIKDKGYSRHWSIAQEVLFQLPTKNGKIDFGFMESFIEESEREKIQKLDEYLETNGFKDYTLTSEEDRVLVDFESGKVGWREFVLGGLFDIATGRDVIIGNVIEGTIPLISHQHDNNGITKKIAQLENRRLFNYKDTLPLADRGVFLATTQNEDFHIGTRVKALKFKDGEKDLKSRLFFVSSINKLQILFTEYSENATDNLPNLKISLPTKNNKPDYKIMETLISAIQKLVARDMVEYVGKKMGGVR